MGVAVLVGGDLVWDAVAGGSLVHVGLEAAGALLAAAGAAWFGRRYLTERAEATSWRARAEELLDGMGGTIGRQFSAWGLTEAEAEVGLLLLKGLSFKEVAAVRETSERTAREQARAVYRKADVAGRAELSAWFLEDLL